MTACRSTSTTSVVAFRTFAVSDDNSLGPKDQFCRSVGGDLKVATGVELAFPLPFVESSGTRLALFVDVGNVYRNWDSFDSDLLRASAGISLTWQAPVGPIIINLAKPIRGAGKVTIPSLAVYLRWRVLNPTPRP